MIIVIDKDGHERMRRDTENTILSPPPGWDEARWAGKIVEDLIRQIDKEARSFVVKTEDGATLKEGERAYNYYDMKPGKIGRLSSMVSDPNPWFDFEHDDGTVSLLNGQRICTIGYARQRGFKGV